MLKAYLPLALAAGLSLAALSVASSQPVSQPNAVSVISVSAKGTVTTPPDWAAVSGTVRAQAKDQQTALRLMSVKQDAISQGLARLAGAKTVSIKTVALTFTPMLPAGCHGDDDAGYPPNTVRTRGNDVSCEPIGVEGMVKLTAIIHPAERMGAAASLAVQLGMEDVQMSGSGVDDDEALEANADRAAFDQAMRQAKMLAAAANAHLGRIIRLNRSGAQQLEPDDGYKEFSDEAVKVDLLRPPPPIAPDVVLNLTPPKVTKTNYVLVDFELIK
jgi:uncharacterized protein YggE